MDVYTWVIFLYVAGTLTVGWFLLHEVHPTSHRRKEKLVGPNYWGIYNGVTCEEGLRTIKLHDLEDDDLGGTYGGSNFPTAKTVKSGRA